MTRRNLSPFVFFDEWGKRHRPKHAFRGTTPAQFNQWKKTLRPKVLATLGAAPSKVPPRPELITEWEADGLIKQRWVLDVQPNLSATLYVFRPGDLKRSEKRPAILACHGHGTFGKDSVMGIGTEAAMAKEIQQHNYDYGLQMARQGFVTYAIDWLGFGERGYAEKNNHAAEMLGQRDSCNISYLCATMLGTTPLALNCHDGSRVTDFVCTLPFVDKNRLGVMGLSQGGTMTTWMMVTDSRFKAGDIICYAGPWYDIAYRTYNVCGSQVTPGCFVLADIADIQGLIAPRPLLVEIGVHDGCFQVDHALPHHFKQLKKIYRAAGAADRLELDLFPGPHAWGANKSAAFFAECLGLN